MIQGILAPKIYVGGNYINLDYVSRIMETPEGVFMESQSEIDAKRVEFLKGCHIELQVDIHLHKYENPKTFFANLMQYYGQYMNVFKHRDGPAYTKKDTTDWALFIFKEYKLSYLTTTDFKDFLTLRFRSIDPVKLTLTAT